MILSTIGRWFISVLTAFFAIKYLGYGINGLAIAQVFGSGFSALMLLNRWYTLSSSRGLKSNKTITDTKLGAVAKAP